MEMKLNMLRTFCQAIFLFVLPMLLACGDDSLQTEETLSEIRAQNSGRYVRNLQIDDPPKNSYLADSSWSIGHANSYAQASSSWAGPAWKIAEQTEDFILNPNTGVFIFSGPYPDGSRVIWIQGPTRLTKIDSNGSRMRVIDSVETKPPLWPAHVKMDAVGKMSNKAFSMILSRMELKADIERREGKLLMVLMASIFFWTMKGPSSRASAGRWLPMVMRLKGIACLKSKLSDVIKSRQTSLPVSGTGLSVLA